MGAERELSKARFRVLNMKQEEMLKQLFADVAFFCKKAIEEPARQRDYQYKASGVRHAMETIGLISIDEFCLLTSMLWDSANLNRLFNYANRKGGHFYEL